MTTSKFVSLLAFALAAGIAGCTIARNPAPPLQGPSELGTSLTITANPSVLSMDGASQSAITVRAFDANGQPKPNLLLRADILANGSVVDFGSLSGRSRTTDSNGLATFTYTAPVAVAGAIPTLSILITPAETDAASELARRVEIRLVPPGVITGPGPTAAFTFNPPAPVAFTVVTFDASTSTPPPVGSIASYAWDFSDGSKATGTPAIHQFRSAGTFAVFLTVTDSNGAASTTSKLVTVSASPQPTANFTVAPASPNVNQLAFFDGSTSVAGAGRTLTTWDWDFGPGSAPRSGVAVSKSWDVAATYLVTLTVTDDAGQTGIKRTPVTVTAPAGSGTITARFTITPNPAAPGQTITFDGSASTATAPAVIQQYQWNFNDGTGIHTTYAPSTTMTWSFATPGLKNVDLTVVDSTGAFNSVTHTVTVQ
jgi:large repetitive protein